LTCSKSSRLAGIVGAGEQDLDEVHAGYPLKSSRRSAKSRVPL
jgi:hypothetical protein